MLSALIQYVTLLVAALLLGSIPWGLIVTKAWGAPDPRTLGSGNIGATNVRRTVGWPAGLLTLFGDLLKGAVPVYLALQLGGLSEPWGALGVTTIALTAIIGHMFPVYFKFSGGGKGVATTAGCVLVISPLAALIALLVFIMLLCWSSRVSLASLTAVLTLPLLLWKITTNPFLLGWALLVMGLVVWRHVPNVRRLLRGAEPTWRQ